MNKIYQGLFMLFIFTLASCAAPPSTTDNYTLPISSISVVMDNNYPPYTFIDSEGELQGILVDQWKLWEEHTGIKAELFGLPWGDALDRMKAGEFDVIDTIFYTEERAQIFDFTKPYADINVRIFFRNSISGIANAQNLKGFRVAVKRGDANVDYLVEQGITSLVYYNSYEEIVQATANNEENIFVIDEPPAIYFLYKNDIRDEFNYSEPLYSGQFHRAVRKGNTETLTLVNQGFSSIQPKEYQEIDARWFGTQQENNLAEITPYLGAGLGATVLVIFSLILLNRTLKTRVNERTEELKNALVTLQESEALFRDSIEFMPIPISIANEDGKILGVNYQFTEHYGYTLEDIPTISDWVLTAYPDPDYRKEVMAQWNTDVQEAIKNGISTPQREYLVTGKDGQKHDVEIMMRPVGKTWVTSFVEVTERKKAEAKLKSSRERYRAVVDNQTEFIVRCKLDGTRTFVNEAYCRHFGITFQDAIGKDFFDLIEEKDRDIILEKYARIASGEIDIETDVHRVINADGSIGWQEWVDQAIRDKDGTVIEIQSVGRDVTKRKKAEDSLLASEKRYQALFEDSPVPLLEEDFSAVKKVIDEIRDTGVKDFRAYFESHPEVVQHCLDLVQIVDVNKTAVTWNQCNSKEELCGSLGTYISKEEHDSFVDELVKLIEDGGHYETTVSRHTIAGEPIHLIINGTVAPGFEHNWGRVLISILDITERKISEEKLLNAYDNTLWGWAKALEYRDKETEGHSRRVVDITIKLAQALGITNEDELVNIRRGAILHDVGKLGIPDEVLLKSGELTNAEWKIMIQHPWLGYRLLLPIAFLKGSLDIVRYHHEKWDGSGYLSGLKGEQIPLAARIFAIVDVWDAVQSARPYKKAWSRDKAIRLIKSESGRHFDPTIAGTFLELVEKGEI